MDLSILIIGRLQTETLSDCRQTLICDPHSTFFSDLGPSVNTWGLRNFGEKGNAIQIYDDARSYGGGGVGLGGFREDWVGGFTVLCLLELVDEHATCGDL